MKARLGCVVEGEGDSEAVPVLVRRVVERVTPGLFVDIPRPVITSRNKLMKEGGLERAVALAAANVNPDGPVLILIDSDDGCPREIGAHLLDRAKK